MVCPVGRCPLRFKIATAMGGGRRPVEAAYCLNANPVYDLFCMAQVVRGGSPTRACLRAYCAMTMHVEEEDDGGDQDEDDQSRRSGGDGRA